MQPNSSQSLQIYRTTYLQLAVALHCTKRLPFIGCRRLGDDQVEFVFADDHNDGETIANEFNQDKILAPIGRTLNSLRFLRKQMEQTMRGGTA